MSEIKKNKISPMIGFWVMVATAVCAVAARTIQLFCAIDYETGFYKSHFSVALLNGILWIGLPISILLTLIGMGERYKGGGRALGKNVTLAVFLAVAAALTAIQTLGMLYSNLYCASANTGSSAVGFTDWLMVILVAGSCAAFAACAVNSFKGRTFGFYIVLPAVYMACKLMMTFMALTTIANISENLFNILSLSAAAVFMCEFAKVGMGYAGKTSLRLLVVSAFCTAVFGFVYVLPNYILTVCDIVGAVNVGSFANSVVSVNFDELAVCILAVVYTGVLLKNGRKQKENASGADLPDGEAAAQANTEEE